MISKKQIKDLRKLEDQGIFKHDLSETISTIFDLRKDRISRYQKRGLSDEEVAQKFYEMAITSGNDREIAEAKKYSVAQIMEAIREIQ